MGLPANATADPNFEYDETDVELQRIAAAVSAKVEEYAPGAPQSCRDEALVRGIVWLRGTAGWGEVRMNSPQRDWTVSRLGPQMPDSMVRVADVAFARVLASCGVPPSLFWTVTEPANVRGLGGGT